MRLSAARSRGVALASKPHAARLAAAQARFTLDDARVITAGADGVVLQWRHCRFGAAAEATLANGQLVIRVLRGELERPLAFHPVAR